MVFDLTIWYSTTMLKRFFESKYLPWILGVVAVVVMLPALKTGLMMDDLIQRFPQLKPSQIPPGLYRTGAVPDNPGQLSTVMSELFGFPRDRKHWKMGRNYGLLPWWLPDETRCSLWRPLTALTHWMDYRLFPDSPVLMHIHNIVWFAAIVFLAAVMYRKIIGPVWIAGLAALMFVLDSNTYFPVMFVANRGFLIALCFGLLCFYAHYKWRTENSTSAACLSILFLLLSLLSNEAGVSTFAFILAYALVLDRTSWSKRLLSLLPAILTIVIWRIVYQSLGYGISGIGAAYLDPGHEPLKFLVYLPAYFTAIIAGQLSAVPPDIIMGFNTQWLKNIALFYALFAAVAVLLFIPAVRKNRLARFWFAVMMFAAVPIVAAPMAKNFGFVAVGAYGLIAVFTASLFGNPNGLPGLSLYKHPARILCIMLLIAHIPLAIFSRYTTPELAPAVFGLLTNPESLSKIPLSNDSRVVIVNATCRLTVCVMPFQAAYYGRPVPQSIRALGFAYTALEITRRGDKTLVVKSKESSIFTSNQRSLVHLSHAFALADMLFYDSRMFEKNQKYVLEGMRVEVLELDDKHLPRKLAFTFDVPLEDKNFCWLQFDWKTFSYKPFILPKPGETVITQGPPVFRFSDAVRFLTGSH